VTPTEQEARLGWLMIFRVVVVTTLLVAAFAIELLFRPAETLRPRFFMAAGAYGMVLLYAVLHGWMRGSRWFVYLQLLGDALVVTFFVRITGGIDSPVSFLYLVPVAVAALMLHRGGALTVAVASLVLYAGPILLAPTWPWFAVRGTTAIRQDPGRLVYFLLAHLGAMLAVALLSSYLAERFRAQGRELAERQGAVARLQALNENIIESINSGLITTDLAGRANFINRGGSEITGLGQADVEGRHVETLLGLEDGCLLEVRRKLLARRRFRFEKWFDTQDGRRIFMGIAVSNLYDKVGHPLGYILIFQDLTDIHALEQEVRLHERMVALGEMAAGMAHELRNPLASISGAVQYLKSELEPTGETLELMDIILRESDRLEQAIRDFLTFARPGPFAAERVDLVRLLEDQAKLLRKSREFRPGHALDTRWQDATMPCDVDANRMKQVFWNLATNGLKAMPDGGTLTIEAAWSADGEQVEITFVDRGCGMDELQKARYFQPFSSSFAEGTGLGAAIVYRLVEEHGGRICLDSDVERGTRVRVVLPRARSGSEGQPRLALVGGGRR
jgi:two-component system sensor histidine kinase PilS (NtrC family)